MTHVLQWGAFLSFLKLVVPSDAFFPFVRDCSSASKTSFRSMVMRNRYTKKSHDANNLHLPMFSTYSNFYLYMLEEQVQLACAASHDTLSWLLVGLASPWLSVKEEGPFPVIYPPTISVLFFQIEQELRRFHLHNLRKMFKKVDYLQFCLSNISVFQITQQEETCQTKMLQ